MITESMAEALMMSAPGREGPQHMMRARDLGKQLNIVKAPWGGCPFCFAPKTTMVVFENGVQWPCGCARAIDPIHGTEDGRIRCKKCNPVEESNVVQFRRSA